MDGVVDDEAAQAGAALPGGADGREGDAADGEVEVGARRDDRRVVAAELEDQAPEAAGDDGSDGAPHPRRPGRRDDGDVGVGGERGADVGSALQHLVEAARRADLGGGALQQGIAGERRQRRLVGGLPQHRVAGDEGEGGVPRPHRDREVERRDHGARAHRVPGLHQPVARPLAGDRQPVQLAREADGEVADVDHLLDLAETLGADLAGLDRHQLAELGLVLAQQLAETADEAAAHGRRGGSPLGERLDGGRHGGVDVGGRTGGAERAAGDRRARRQVAGRVADADGVEDRVGALGEERGGRGAIVIGATSSGERRDGVGEDRHRGVGLLDGDDERRREADAALAARQRRAGRGGSTPPGARRRRRDRVRRGRSSGPDRGPG